MPQIFRHPENPLAKYLQSHDETPYSFAKRIKYPLSTIKRILERKHLYGRHQKTATDLIEATKGELKLEDFGF